MEPPEEPPEKRRRTGLSECCVFCETTLSKTQAENPVVQNPRVEGLKAILKAAELRKDGVYDRLFPVKDDILHGSTVIKFHQKCRANYTNMRNIQIAKRNTATCADGVTDDGATGSGPTVGLSRLWRYDTSQLGRAPPHGKMCLMQLFRETTMRFKCECCQTLTCLQWMQNIINLAIRITSRLTILKLLVLGLRLINLTMRVPSKVCVRRLKRLSCPKPPLSQPCLS